MLPTKTSCTTWHPRSSIACVIPFAHHPLPIQPQIFPCLHRTDRCRSAGQRKEEEFSGQTILYTAVHFYIPWPRSPDISLEPLQGVYLDRMKIHDLILVVGSSDDDASVSFPFGRHRHWSTYHVTWVAMIDGLYCLMQLFCWSFIFS